MAGAVILAGGRGRRAGAGNKLLTRDAAGVAMIGRTAALVARAFPTGQRVLATGHEAARVAAAARAAVPDLEVVSASDHAEGMAATLRAGVEHAGRAGWTAVLVFLGDMPLVGPGTVAAVLDGLADAAVQVVFPERNGRRGHPVLWRRALFPRLLVLSGDGGGRALLDAPGIVRRAVPCDDPGAFADFDTPDRLELFRAMRGSAAD